MLVDIIRLCYHLKLCLKLIIYVSPRTIDISSHKLQKSQELQKSHQMCTCGQIQFTDLVAVFVGDATALLFDV